MSTIDLQALQAEVADLAARRDIHKALNQYMRGQDRLLPDVQRASALMLGGPQANIAGLVGRWVGAGERFRNV